MRSSASSDGLGRGAGRTLRRAAAPALVLALALGGCGGNGGHADVVATVDGEPVTRAVADAYARARTGRPFAELSAPDQATVVRDVVRLAVAARASADLADDPATRAELELARLEHLARHTVARRAGPPPDEAALRAEYAAQRAAAPADDYRVRHVLVPTEALAREALAALARGTPFAQVAARYSQDTSKDAGGDLGWVDLGRLPKALADAVRGLKAGARLAEPLRTDYGWHVVEVTETRPAAAPPFEAVKAQLAVTLRERRERELLDGLVGAARVELAPEQAR